MKKRKIVVEGYTLKKPFLKRNSQWCYFDDGIHLIPICYRKGFEKTVDLRMFKKVRIILEEL